MFVNDIQGSNHIMLNDMNKDIVLAHVSIIGFHMASIFLGQTVISLDSGAELF